MSDELRERFHALRRKDASDAPDFRATLSRARSREAALVGARRGWLWAPALAAAAALTALAILLPSVGPEPAPWTPGRWAMPTDVLLDVPGSELLRELPWFGTDRDRPVAPPRTSSLRRISG